MTITNRALNRVIARIERQLPEPGTDGLHGQHAITLPAMDWWFLVQAVKELDASQVRLMQRDQTEAPKPIVDDIKL